MLRIVGTNSNPGQALSLPEFDASDTIKATVAGPLGSPYMGNTYGKLGTQLIDVDNGTLIDVPALQYFAPETTFVVAAGGFIAEYLP